MRAYRANEVEDVWEHDPPAVVAMREEWLDLESKRLGIVHRQQALASATVTHRTKILTEQVIPQQTEELITLMAMLAETVRKEGLSWEGRLQAGSSWLRASDMHGNFQAKGRCFTWWGNAAQLDGEPRPHAEQLEALAEAHGLDVEAWESQSHMDLGCSLVVVAVRDTPANLPPSVARTT